MNFSIDSIDDLHFLNQVYHDDNQFLEYLNVNCEDFSISNLNQEWI